MKSKDSNFQYRFVFVEKSYKFALTRIMKTTVFIVCILITHCVWSQQCFDTSINSCFGPNLVINGDFESGNTGFQSDYSYGLPGNGAYLILSADATTIISGWQCTGNPGKYFLGDGYIGANNNKAVWRQTISSVKKDSTYVFMVDVNNPIKTSLNGYYKPNITMRINGINIITTSISQVPDKWITMCCMWTANNTSAVIEILETFGNATGCDFTLDNLYFGTYKEFKAMEYRSICNDSIVLDPNESSTMGYLWANGSRSRSLKVWKAGTYSVKYSKGCPVEKVYIVTMDNLSLNLGSRDTFICSGFSLTAVTNAMKVYWNTGDSIKTLNITKSGTYIAHVKNACNQLLRDTMTVKFRNHGNPTFPNDTVICNGSMPFWIKMKDPSFQYKFNGVKGDSLYVDKRGIYLIQAYDSCGNEYIDTFFVHIRRDMNIIFPNDVHFCDGQQAILKIIGGFKSVKWDNGEIQPQILVSVQNPVWFEVTDSCGNIYRDTVMVFKDTCLDCLAYIPNAFTPDNNGKNEKFSPVFNCPLVEMNFTIFNRWGELLYNSWDLNAQWDGSYKGEVCEQDVYMYIITAKISNRNIYRYFHMTGTFHLLR